MYFEEMNVLLAQIRNFSIQASAHCSQGSAPCCANAAHGQIMDILEKSGRHASALEAMLAITPPCHDYHDASTRQTRVSQHSLVQVMHYLCRAARLTDDDIIQVGAHLDDHMQCVYSAMARQDRTGPGRHH